MIVHRALVSVNRSAKSVTVSFDGSDLESYMAYRKTWSMKRYVDAAMEDLNVVPAWDMSYGWQG